MLNAYVFITSHIAGLQAKRSERGATATEYGLLVAFIAIAIIVGVTAFGTALNGFFGRISGKVAGWAP